MGDMALITVVGRLTKDATAEALQNSQGRVMVKYTVASSYYVKGQDQRPTTFYEVRQFMAQDRFNTISPMLRKAALVMVWGQLRPHETQDQSGQKKIWFNIEEAEFSALEPKKNDGQQPANQGGGQPPAQSRYATDPKYPGYYFDRQQNQWIQGAIPQDAPPPPPPAPPAPPAGPPAGTPPGYQPGPAAPPPSVPPAQGGYNNPPPGYAGGGQSPI